MLTSKLIETDPVSCLVWLSSSTNLTDSAVFLVRAGSGAPCFARVCTPADMHNYGTTAPTNGGWYRMAGLLVNEPSSGAFTEWVAQLEVAVAGLDGEVAELEAADTESKSLALRRSRTELEFGSLGIVRSEIPGSVKLVLTVTISDSGLDALINDVCFITTTTGLIKLLRVATVDDMVAGSGTVSGEQASNTITVYLNDDPDVEAALCNEICGALEDAATFLEML